MLKQYFRTAFRVLLKNKLVSAVNLTGLSLGLAASILIVMYVSFEFGYDDFHTKKDRIYRVESNFYEGEVLTDQWATSSFGYGPAMKDNIPGIEGFARIALDQTEQIVGYKEEFFRENTITYADTGYFGIFDFKLIEGDSATWLKEPNSVVVTKNTARKLFGNKSAMGELISFSTSHEKRVCKITGVIENPSENSHIKFDYFISYSSLPEWKKDFWYLHEVYTYVLLDKGHSPAMVEAAFPAMAEKYKTREALKSKTWGISLVPLKDIHLNQWKQYERENKGNRTALYSLLTIAVIILVIAWGNYINISIARSYERTREIAIRKFTGAGRRSLFQQFILESTVVNMLALILSLGLVVLALPYFRLLTGSPFTLDLLNERMFLIVCILVFALGTFTSGFYPAMVLSSFKPINSIKGGVKAGKQHFSPRKILMVIQFGMSLFLIAGTMIVFQQIQFMQTQSLGVDVHKKVVLKFPAKTDNLEERMESFSEQLKNRHDIQSVTLSGSVPGMEVATFLSNRLKSGRSSDQNRLYEMLTVDFDYLDTYQIPIVAGRPFDRKFGNELNKLIVNELSLELLEITNPEEAIGQKVLLEGQPEPFEIIGVTRNWHQKSLNNDYTPIMFIMNSAISWIAPGYITIDFAGQNYKELTEGLEQTWKSYFENSSFDYFYVDDFFDSQYKDEENHGTVLTLFTVLALIVSCLGLFALTSHAADKRVKEIGIRKVLGASAGSIVLIFSRETLYLIGMAIIMAIPVSMFTMNSWLNNYPFRTEIEWHIYTLSMLVLIIISMGTVIGQSLKAATANPVQALKHE